MDTTAVGLGAASGGFGALNDIVGAYDQQDIDRALAQGNLGASRATAPMIEDAWKTQQDMWGGFGGGQVSAGWQKLMGLANDPFFSQDPAKFQFDKTVNDYIDPALDYIIKQGVRGLDASASAGGGLFSSGHGRAVTSYAQDESAKEKVRAQQRYREDRQQAYTEYKDFLEQQLERRKTQASILGTGTQIGMSGLSSLSTQRANYDTSRINNTRDEYIARGQLKAANEATDNMWLRGGLGLASGVAGGALKAIGG